MRKIVCLTMMLFCVSLTVLQAQNSEKNVAASENVVNSPETLIEKFCNYLEVIGNTKSVSEDIKNRIRRYELPELFYKYDMRKVTTFINDKGVVKSHKSLPDYFRHLQVKAKSHPNLDTHINVLYNLDYVFRTSADGVLNWNYLTAHNDGTKEYEVKVIIFQTCLSETLKGNEVVDSTREDVKIEISLKQLLLPNMEKIYKLGDITILPCQQTLD